MPEENTASVPVQTKLQDTTVITKGEKLLSGLGYIPFFCVLPLALRPTSAYCQFHGKQSLVLVIFFFVISWIGWMSRSMGMFFGILQFVVVIFAAMQALKGNKWKIPFVSQVAEKLNWNE
jgi:uncharacterized membrane protein